MDFSGADQDFSTAVADTADVADRSADFGNQAVQMLYLLINDLCDGNDHPEIWQAFPQFLAALPDLPAVAEREAALHAWAPPEILIGVTIVRAMCRAHGGDIAGALLSLQTLSTQHNQSPMIEGAIFHLQGMLDPENPKYQLAGKVCLTPFTDIHVLERSSHLCCASWLGRSVGDLNRQDWDKVWNSEDAERIRASIHDGSYRHCNKTACPVIQENGLVPAAEVAAKSEKWRAIIEGKETFIPGGPEKVNLAYDRTCNLSCPSCRTSKYAADEATRQRYDQLQERSILPMLKNAKTVFITGSGDPFASKNFRRLMERLGPEDYPDLRFIVMTNAMLLTRREWARFPALHERVQILQISIDAAAKETHELLRRGARWEVMRENLAFASELLATGQVSEFHLSFTVQAENYREMGDAADLAEELGATNLYFGRITNWGTFTPEEYAAKAVFVETHPEYEAFLEAMQDPRLLRPRVQLGNMREFVREAA